MDRRERANDPLIAIRAVLDGFQTTIWTAMPGILQSYDPTKGTCTVQPAIQEPVPQKDGTIKNTTLPLLIYCPVVLPGCAGFVLTMPLAVGDEGLVVFAARAIDAWWQQGNVQPPIESRMHDLSDGFFIPGCFSRPNVIPGVSTTSTQLRNKAGDTYVEIASGHIVNIVAPGVVKVTGNTEITGNTKVDGSSEFVGNTKVDGQLEVVGKIVGDTEIDVVGPIKLNGGASLTRLLAGSVSISASFSAFGLTTTTTTVTGAQVGDHVTVNPIIVISATIVIQAFVSAPNTVTVILYNASNFAVVLTATTFSVLVVGAT